MATAGVGLAFIAFPTIVSEAPLGALMGVLFFGSLVFAGMTSLISILEVIVAAVQDKTGWGRVASAVSVCVPVALISIVLFPTVTGLYLLDTFDAFVNSFGILAGALVAVVLISWVFRKLPLLSKHLNRTSSIKMRRTWMVLVGVVAPLALAYMLYNEFVTKITEPYEGYPVEFLAIYGWGMAGALVVVAVILTLVPWSRKSKVDDPEYAAIAAHEDEEKVS